MSTIPLISDGVRLKEGKFPEVFWNGKWVPICGHNFWDSNYGGNLFCQKLNSSLFTSGIVTRSNKPLEIDGLRIGKCLAQDDWLSCTGGGNFLKEEGLCVAGDVASVEIECISDPSTTTTTTTTTTTAFQFTKGKIKHLMQEKCVVVPSTAIDFLQFNNAACGVDGEWTYDLSTRQFKG